MNRREALKKLLSGTVATGAAVVVGKKVLDAEYIGPEKPDDFYLDSSLPMCRECGMYQQVDSKEHIEDGTYVGPAKQYGDDLVIREIHFQDCPRYEKYNMTMRPWGPAARRQYAR